jgi:hypothetical protein
MMISAPARILSWFSCFRFRLADDAKQASRKRTFLLVGPAVAHIA